MSVGERSVRFGLAAALIIALAVAIVPTFMDWRLNPGGLFQGANGTHWGVVFETAWSWFWPVFLGIVPITVLLHAWYLDRRSTRHDS